MNDNVDRSACFPDFNEEIDKLNIPLRDKWLADVVVLTRKMFAEGMRYAASSLVDVSPDNVLRAYNALQDEADSVENGGFERKCKICGKTLHPGSTATYCSQACVAQDKGK